MKEAPEEIDLMKRPVIYWSTPWGGIVALQLTLIILATNVATSDRDGITGPLYNSGIQYRAYGGGPSFPIPTLPDPLWRSELVTRNEDIRHISADTTEVKSEARSAKRNHPHHVDESMVADMLKNPDAMKMVLKYLTKQNLYEHQKKWNQMSNAKKNGKNKRKKNIAKKKTTTTAKPTPPRTTAKRVNLKTTPKSAVVKSDRRKDEIGGSGGKLEKLKKKRRPRPSGDFFDLAQLFASLSGPLPNRKKPNGSGVKEKSRPADLSFLFGPPPRRRPLLNQRPSQRPTPPSNVDNLDNPQLMGDKPKLEYFGPSDFVPQHPYALPMQQHGPMKLTYMSAKEFPNIPKYGLIPIPRRR